MTSGGHAFRSLVALIGLLGGGASFGFFVKQPPGEVGWTPEVPRILQIEEPVDDRPIVIVDAGHGGVDGGAMGSGLLEKDVALGMSRQLGAELEKLGIRVIQSREEDMTISLEERTRLANRHPEAVFVSVHFNTSSAAEVEGLETYHTSPKALSALAEIKRRFGLDTRLRLSDERNRLLAEKVQAAVVAEVECRDRGVRNKSLSVTRETIIPSILVACAYLTHATEAERVASRAYRASLARGIAAGVRDYLDEAEVSGDPLFGLVTEEPGVEEPGMGEPGEEEMAAEVAADGLDP